MCGGDDHEYKFASPFAGIFSCSFGNPLAVPHKRTQEKSGKKLSNTVVSMSTHISKSCSAAFFLLHNIKRISKFLSRDKL